MCVTSEACTHFCRYTIQPVSSDAPSQELEYSVGRKFYHPHASADGSLHIQLGRRN